MACLALSVPVRAEQIKPHERAFSHSGCMKNWGKSKKVEEAGWPPLTFLLLPHFLCNPTYCEKVFSHGPISLACIGMLAMQAKLATTGLCQ